VDETELRWLKIHLHLAKALGNIIKLFINVWMKPELRQLKVCLHLMKRRLHPDNIRKIIY